MPGSLVPTKAVVPFGFSIVEVLTPGHEGFEITLPCGHKIYFSREIIILLAQSAQPDALTNMVMLAAEHDCSGDLNLLGEGAPCLPE